MSVYFIQSGEDGPIKIGLASNVKKRIAALQTAHPHRLNLLGVLDGDADLERELHWRFREHRLNGEWFSPVQELLDAVPESYGQPEQPMPYQEPEPPVWRDFCEPKRLSGLVYVGLTMCGATDEEIAQVARTAPESVAEWRDDAAMPSLEQFLRLVKEFSIFKTCLHIAIHADSNTWEGEQVRASFLRMAGDDEDSNSTRRHGGGSMKPLAVDLFCGLGGWSDGLLAEGWDVIGFDIEQHAYGEHRYPAALVIQDVLTLHGSQFRDADLIVASPPCQEYSYMAMPWTRAKQIASALRGNGEFPDGYAGSRTVEELNALFNACIRLKREASQAAGRDIPLIVENVCGANPWVGRARWNFGSFYLWGDVPALMPSRFDAQKCNPDGTAHGQGSWFKIADSKNRGARSKYQASAAPRMWRERDVARLNDAGVKGVSRKAASAMIAKIPLPLARHIGRAFYPQNLREAA